MRAGTAGVAGLTAGALLVLASYWTVIAAGAEHPATAWLMIGGVSAMMGAAFMLPGRGRGRRTIAIGVATLLAGIFGLVHLLPADEGGARLIGGFPVRAALIIYGVALLPALVLPALHAMSFDATGLDPESLARFRDECRRLRGER